MVAAGYFWCPLNLGKKCNISMCNLVKLKLLLKCRENKYWCLYI